MRFSTEDNIAFSNIKHLGIDDFNKLATLHETWFEYFKLRFNQYKVFRGNNDFAHDIVSFSLNEYESMAEIENYTDKIIVEKKIWERGIFSSKWEMHHKKRVGIPPGYIFTVELHRESKNKGFYFLDVIDLGSIPIIKIGFKGKIDRFALNGNVVTKTVDDVEWKEKKENDYMLLEKRILFGDYSVKQP